VKHELFISKLTGGPGVTEVKVSLRVRAAYRGITACGRCGGSNGQAMECGWASVNHPAPDDRQNACMSQPQTDTETLALRTKTLRAITTIIMATASRISANYQLRQLAIGHDEMSRKYSAIVHTDAGLH